MADLNKGKFQGLDENAKNNYADSFIGATKVAEKVKKGGSETTSDGYVVDAIDIDWGGLKLTTISDNWSHGLQTESSTEQNAGKGDNTQGIHSTAYLLNKISNSFTQIYNQIGKDDTAADSLRKRIAYVESSIKEITGSDPGKLADLRDRIQKIEQELDNPGAASTLVTILDSLDGFDKTKGGVKSYINDQDKAILGTPTDEATAYTVYGVRKYVDTTAKTTLLGASGDAWPTKHTIYGVAKYAENLASSSYTDAVNSAVKQANDYTNQAIGTAESTLIGTASDATTADTIWGAKNYAAGIQTTLLGAYGDAWPTKHTIYGVAKYSDVKDDELEKRLIGTSTDTTIYTHHGLKHILIGTTSDTIAADTIWGAKKYAVKTLIGSTGDAETSETIYGVRKYTDEKIETLSNTAFKVSRIEEGSEGILVFSTVSSYAG